MKTNNGVILIFFLICLILLQSSCSKNDPPATQPQPDKNHPMIGKWLFVATKSNFTNSLGPLPPGPFSSFTDTTNINFVDSSNYVFTWPVIINFSQPPTATWAKVSGTYHVSQDSILDVFPKKNGTVNNINTGYLSVKTNAFYYYVCWPYSNYVTDTTNYIPSFKMIDPDKMVIVTYYPQGANSKTYTGYDSLFFTKMK